MENYLIQKGYFLEHIDDLFEIYEKFELMDKIKNNHYLLTKLLIKKIKNKLPTIYEDDEKN